MVELELWESPPGLTRFVRHPIVPEAGSAFTVGSIEYYAVEVQELPTDFSSVARVLVRRVVGAGAAAPEHVVLRPGQ